MKSRDGSYKKILIDVPTLRAHGEFLRLNLLTLKSLNLSNENFTTLYLLMFLRIKHPKNWLQKHSMDINAEGDLLSMIPTSFLLNEWEIQKLSGLSPLTLFQNFNLKCIPRSVNKTMIDWILGKCKIEMLDYIPSSRKLLGYQVKNTRCITLITNPREIDSLVLNSRDPLSFVIHDLMHADQFFSQLGSHKGQLGFYNLLYSIYDFPELKEMLNSDENFKKEFEYVASDMNAYVIHLFKCLKSSIARISNLQSHDNLFDKILRWWKMSEEEINSSYKLNTPQFNLADETLLKIFFESNQEILK